MRTMTREQLIDYLESVLSPSGRAVTVADFNLIPDILSALRGLGWVRTTDRLPDGNEHDDVLGLYKGPDYLMYDIVQIGWLRLHPEMYVFWMRLPEKPEVEG